MGTGDGTKKGLKFGVDRILSSEIGTKTLQSDKITESEDRSTIGPCLQCPILRCCPRPTLTYYQTHIFQPIGILHAPKPIRPFPSVLSERDDRQGGTKRKRSWSRAVFSSLQRKGLEKRFQLQKYITKPDRRQLAATLGLTDAQVKVWFQNRRMKWRHTKELRSPISVSENTQFSNIQAQSHQAMPTHALNSAPSIV